MKKVFSAILLFSIITLQSCDFLRKVAGRPVSAEVAAKAVKIQLHKKAVADSLQMLNEVKEIEERRVCDSVATLDSVADLGFVISNKSRFGEPVKSPKYRYNLVIGVFRSEKTVNEQLAKAKKAGFCPYTITFDGGVNAVCLWGGDDLQEFILIAKTGLDNNVCPKDAWIYER